MLTNKLIEYVTKAQRLAASSAHASAQALHVLSVMAADPESVLCSISGLADASIEDLNQSINEALLEIPVSRNSAGQNEVARELSKLLNQARIDAVKQGDSFVSSDRFIQVAVRKDAQVKRVLNGVGINASKVDEVVQNLRAGETVTEVDAEGQQGALTKYTVDLTAQASDDKFDPFIGRHDEIRRTMQILQRRTKNNPVLIGEPGVGKTAIVEGLAQRIVAGEVPEGLRSRRVLMLDITGMLAGAKYRGEFEERLKGVLKEIAKNPDQNILFIDELHILVGAGASEGAVDAANMLKPALARGELRCIGATTLAEYRKRIEKDAALERRFQRLIVQEPDQEAAISILRGLADCYTLHHRVRITDSALVAAVELSSRYITDRFLPDKAIDVIDEAAAKLRIELDSKPERVDRLDRRLAQLKTDEAAILREDDKGVAKQLEDVRASIAQTEEELADLTDVWRKEKARQQAVQQNKERVAKARQQIEKLTETGEYNEAAKLQYETLPELEKQLEQQEVAKDFTLLPLEVDEKAVAEVISRATGIPLTRLIDGSNRRLQDIEKNLRSELVSQNDAVAAVANAMLRAHTGMADPDKPNGSFMFIGPTGVGKTELAKLLAKNLFDSERHLIRIDMSEYMERHSVARLIGAPPGYVGHEEGGQLTEAVRRKPYCVILLDEIEKAHPEVFNLLLQTFDDGRLTDSQGRTVDFRNTVMIMTSNIGSRAIIEEKGEEMRSNALKAVRAHFQPEFLNRLDDIVVFNSLSEDDIVEIARLQVQRLAQRLEKEWLHLEFDEKAIRLLAVLGSDLGYGARPLKRTIQAKIETPLARMLVDKQLSAGAKVRVSVAEREFKFNVEKEAVNAQSI